jgi:DNA-directed RNA polymerase subunit F
MTPHKKKGRSEASVFLDNLSEFLGETEGQDLNDIKRDLCEEGIDADAFVAKVKGVIAQKSSEAKRSWITKAKAGHAATLEKLNEFIPDIPADAAALKERIKQLMTGEQLVGAYFRNYKDMPYEDLRKLYEDYMRLEHMKEYEEDDGKYARQ